MIARYGAGTPRSAEGAARTAQTPVTACPGNRRWIQLVFDSFLLMAASQDEHGRRPGRDARRRHDPLRRGEPGPAVERVRQARPRRDRGQQRRTATPTRRRASPRRTPSEATVRVPAGRRRGVGLRRRSCSSGHYQARAVPVADTDAATPLTDPVSLVPGTYEFVARAPGLRAVRIGPVTVKAGPGPDLPVKMRPNLASSATAGATAAGDGINLRAGSSTTTRPPTGPRSAARSPAGRSPSTWPAASSRYAGFRSARCCDPQIAGRRRRRRQSRFSALRQFRVLACTAQGAVTCANSADFRPVYTSRPDAFPSVAPRPRAPELIMRSFDIPRTQGHAPAHRGADQPVHRRAGLRG